MKIFLDLPELLVDVIKVDEASLVDVWGVGEGKFGSVCAGRLRLKLSDVVTGYILQQAGAIVLRETQGEEERERWREKENERR